MQKVAQSDADTNDHLWTVKWVVLHKLQGQTLVRFKAKRLPGTFSHARGLPAARPFLGSMGMMASKNFLAVTPNVYPYRDAREWYTNTSWGAA